MQPILIVLYSLSFAGTILYKGAYSFDFSYPLLPLCGGGWNSRRTRPYAGSVEILALWRAG